MILHPPVLALLLVALLGAAAMTWAGAFARRMLGHWNLASGVRGQIELERRTHLVATVLTLVTLALGFAVLLMVFNADRTAPLLVGAMCAFGSFNASVYGFPALYTKMALFFAAIVWLALHHADLQAVDYPLTGRKCALVLGLLMPLVLGPRWWPGLAPAYGVFSAVVFFVALLAVVSAVSIYVYEHPHHRCPFCLLKREYGYFGFLLYTPLFLGTACGLASGALTLRLPPSLRGRSPLPGARLRAVLGRPCRLRPAVRLGGLALGAAGLGHAHAHATVSSFPHPEYPHANTHPPLLDRLRGVRPGHGAASRRARRRRHAGIAVGQGPSGPVAL